MSLCSLYTLTLAPLLSASSAQLSLSAKPESLSTSHRHFTSVDSAVHSTSIATPPPSLPSLPVHLDRGTFGVGETRSPLGAGTGTVIGSPSGIGAEDEKVLAIGDRGRGVGSLAPPRPVAIPSLILWQSKYVSSLGNKRVELFDMGAGASDPTADDNVQMASGEIRTLFMSASEQFVEHGVLF
ncbi:hypothetical protein TEA_004209 [Camellia sinensis var. sinensis]|uniref:Uncharacterized protein n=1 Tax=Camellia sinensis var. sinensis TaxID=542762 RepID=A0A4S4DRJ2_CAMSN|nr:hypothetical protein TEA_004209 [Camellia sinensis var. sinensis]